MFYYVHLALFATIYVKYALFVTIFNKAYYIVEREAYAKLHN